MDDRSNRFATAIADRYRIESEIGSGGMATVYLAQDLKHDRKVAVKVLKPELAAVLGGERFLSEIKVTANLQHPHILPLHDSGEADGFLFYVMPYVEGESLRAKLDREKQLSVDEAVGIAKSVANALDYAHRHGVIHRDIKPANILLHDGQPMVADFGIALAVRAAGGARLTETGLSLGTPQYMSPEQASGDREVDGRSDIYSLGAVFYEMLTGEPPHSGPTVQAIIAKLLVDKPRPVAELRETVPVHVAATVHKALAKLPADRFGGAGEISESLSGRGTAHTATVGIPKAGESSSSQSSRRFPWAVVLVLAALVITQRYRDGVVRAPLEVRYFNIALDDTLPLAFVGEAWGGISLPAMALSPDGTTLAYVGQVGETTRLLVRSLDGFGTRALPGTEGALDPVFSPDGERVAFTANNRLHQILIAGGTATPVTEANQPYGTSWGGDGRIVSVTQDARTLLLTGASGTDATRRPIGGTLGTYMAEPRWLPDSEWFLVTCYSPFVLCAVSSETLEVRPLMANAEAGAPNGTPLRGTNPRFIEPGYLIFSAPGDNTVMGVRFDPSRLAVLGDPVELLSGVRRESMHGALQLSVSASGDMVYAPGEDGVKAHLVWAEPGGVRDTLPFPPRIYGPYYLSPDETRIAALVTSDVGEFELYFLDLARGISQRWRREGPDEEGVLYYGGWLPDSRSAVVTIVRSDTSRLVQIDALSSTGGTTLWEGRGMVAGQGFSEGGTGTFTIYGPEGSYPSQVSMSDLPNLPHDVLEAFPPAIERVGGEAFMSRSPNGEWDLFNSDSEGQWELFAHRVGTDDVIKISTDGADIGRWTAKGDGLYFRKDQSFFWIGLTGDPENPFTPPQFYLEGDFLNVPGPELSVHSDGKRLLLLEGSPARTTTRLNFVQNWRRVLEERLGGGR
jgi:tRNA A-37 threonylcarbamoyl transferase component Bud32/Tol biopolymer transport system component